MGYPVGLAPNGAGDGTEPEDVQRWIWSLYRSENPGIARGLTVTGRSDMRYNISSGVVILPNGDQQAIAVPVSAVNVSTLPAPSSGSRTDYIYVGADGAVGVGTSQPANTALIDKRTVPAGITATTATVSQLGNRNFAPLYGSSMGQLMYWKHSAADLTQIKDSAGQERTMVTDTITIDSDRRLEFQLQVSMEMTRGSNTKAWGWKRDTFVWSIWIDNVRRWSTELGVSEFPETKFASVDIPLTAGTYKIELRRTRRLIGTEEPSTDFPRLRTGGSEQWPGTTFKVMDQGATV